MYVSTPTRVLRFNTATRAWAPIASAPAGYSFQGVSVHSSTLPCSAPPGFFCNGSAFQTCPGECLAQPGSFCSGGSPLPCPGGTFSKRAGATSCAVCPAGHYCPPGTSSWARLNCGLGNFCPEGSSSPTPCPLEVVPAPYASWAAHPKTAQGLAFLDENAICLGHCFFSVRSGDGWISRC